MPEISDLDARVLAELKKGGLYDALAVNAAKSQPAAADVHVSDAGDKTKPKKTPADGENILEVDGEHDIAKRLREADPVFAKTDASLYVYRPLTPGTAQRLHAWATAAGMKNIVPPEMMHVTQVHSKVAVDGLKPLTTVLDAAESPRFLSPLGDKGALVLFVGSPEMEARFKEAAKAGAKWDFPSYRPHVTLSYDAGNAAEWSMVQPPDFPIQLGPEKFEAVNENWATDTGLRKFQEFEATLAISKMVPEQRLVFGWASVCSVNGVQVIDKQDDIIPVDELETAAYDFVLYSREQGDMHNKRDAGKLVESLMFTPEKEALGIIAKNEAGEVIHGWWVGFRVNSDPLWEAHKRGERPEFSIGGHATPVQQ